MSAIDFVLCIIPTIIREVLQSSVNKELQKKQGKKTQEKIFLPFFLNQLQSIPCQLSLLRQVSIDRKNHQILSKKFES
jgi:hypothetical protein